MEVAGLHVGLFPDQQLADLEGFRVLPEDHRIFFISHALPFPF
jgi:hypothetical protein